MTEEIKCKILEVFGYAPEDLDCANADTAMDLIFEEDYSSNPMSILALFIADCSKEDFAELKEILKD